MPTYTGTAGVEDITGSDGYDIIDGRGGADRLRGGAGDDTFLFTVPRTAGAVDTTGSVDGGEGIDTIDLSGATGAVVFNRIANSIILTFGQDQFSVTNVERFLLGSAADFVTTSYPFVLFIDMGGGNDALDSVFVGSTVRGGDGNDILRFEGNRFLYGDTGDDTFQVGISVAGSLVPGGLIDGGAGNDTARFVINDRNAVIDLAAGTATSGGSTFTIRGIETVYAYDGLVRGDAANNVLVAISAGGTNLTLEGGDGDDVLIGSGGADRLLGGDGNDLIEGRGGADVLDGGAGIDTVAVIVSSNVSLAAGTIIAGSTTQTITGFENIRGSGAADTLVGDAGANRLEGGAGADLIRGGAGDDTILGQDGDDLLFGDAGNDVIDGGAGFDTVYGGDGDDQITETSSQSATGREEFHGEGGNDIIRVQREGPNTTTLITGGDGDDTIDVFGSGAFQLVGGAGRDVFINRTSVATIETGEGSDLIRLFNQATAFTMANAVRVTDFTAGAGGDVLSLVNIIPSVWDGVTNPFAAGYVSLTQSGADVIVSMDWYERGPFNPAPGPVAILRNVQISQLTAENFGGFDPGGTAPTQPITLVGTEAADELLGGLGNDILSGRGGDDVILGGAGNDSLYGEAGNDRLRGGAGDDGLDGGDGDDVLYGEVGNDVLVGQAGNDTLSGDAGNDALDGGSGNDLLYGGDGDDIISGRAGNDTIDGGAGFDVAVFSGSRADTTFTALTSSVPGLQATGPEGIDILRNIEAIQFADGVYDIINGVLQTDARRTLQGGPGDDILIGGTSSDTISGGAGNDQIRAFSGDNILDGGDGDDIFYLGGGAANDTIRGGAGRDRLVVEGSTSVTIDLSRTDRVQGGFGTLTVSGVEDVIGGGGDDIIIGDAGSNRLEGGAGGDRLFGGDGDDVLVGGAGIDQFQGGAGFDTVVLEGARSAYTIGFFPAQTWLIDGPDGREAASGIEAFEFSDGTYDILGPGVLAAQARQNLLGTANGETLTGGQSNDTLSGQGGDDILVGLAGNDVLNGGAGVDTADYVGVRRQYVANATTVSGNGEGTDTLVSIENARFVDGTLTFDVNSQAAQVMRLYDAALDRNGDPGGLEGLLDRLERGESLVSLAQAFLSSPEFPQRYGNLSNQAFIEQMYRFCLNREGDPGGIQTWTDRLNSSTTRAEMLVIFSESQEHRDLTAPTLNQGLWVADDQALIIARLYDATFDRLADVGGFTTWVNNLKGGMAVLDIAAAFASAAEFQQRYGTLTNQQFIEQMYRFCLNREADPGGLAVWTNALNSGTSRAQMLLTFSESAEHISLTSALWLGGVRYAGYVGAPVEQETVKDAPAQVSPLIDALPYLNDHQANDALVLPPIDDGFLIADGLGQDPVSPLSDFDSRGWLADAGDQAPIAALAPPSIDPDHPVTVADASLWDDAFGAPWATPNHDSQFWH